MPKFYNVKGASVAEGQLTTELIKPSEEFNVKSVSLANVHATVSAAISLFIQDNPTSGTTNTYKILSTVVVPVSTTLFLDNPSMFKFGEEFGLYITVGDDNTVDIIIN